MSYRLRNQHCGFKPDFILFSILSRTMTDCTLRCHCLFFAHQILGSKDLAQNLGVSVRYIILILLGILND